MINELLILLPARLLSTNLGINYQSENQLFEYQFSYRLQISY